MIITLIYTLTEKDGNGLYVGLTPQPIRPRIPHQIIMSFGGWQEGVPSTLMEVYDIRTNKWFDTKLSHDSPRAYHGMEVSETVVYSFNKFNIHLKTFSDNQWIGLCDRRNKWHWNTEYCSVF